MPQTRVYHYINPANGNHISSLLPPDHPEMVCLQEGSHVEETKFGLLGALSLFFSSFFSLFVERFGADAGFVGQASSRPSFGSRSESGCVF